MNRTNFIFSAGIYIIKYCFYKKSLIEGTAFLSGSETRNKIGKPAFRIPRGIL